MNTISCIVVDDEPLAVRLMESYVAKTPFLSLKGSFTSGTAAYSFLQDNPVDLLFCDIQMPNLSGMDLSRMLPERTRIIFTTAFSEYAVEGFKVRALDYLLKPISYEDFLSAAMKAKEYLELIDDKSLRQAQRPSGLVTEPGVSTLVTEPAVRRDSPTTEVTEPAVRCGSPNTEVTEPAVRRDSPNTEVTEPAVRRDSPTTEVTEPAVSTSVTEPVEVTEQRKIKSIFVKTEYRLQQIDLDRITYIEGLKDYVKIHLNNGTAPILSLMRLKALEDTLPKEDFVRVHKSFIVRLAAIEAIERNHILIGPSRIPIGDTYQTALYQALSGSFLLLGGKG